MRAPRFLFALLLSSLAVMIGSPARSQQMTPDAIELDATLGIDVSNIILTETETVSGQEVNTYTIEGGIRPDGGSNLFHSFADFNVAVNEKVYFANPADVNAIFSRVTGDNPSNILGTLGISNNGPADLFFINPNGIVFGENADLDLQGSFTATTADSMQLGPDGSFNARTPENSNLLSVKPSAFFFGSSNPRSTIMVDSSARLNSPLDRNRALQLEDGNALTFVAGDIVFDSGIVNVWEGRVSLAAVAGVGSVQIKDAERGERALSINDNVQRGNITFTNDSDIDVQLSFGGDIELIANNIDILGGSRLLGGVERKQGSPQEVSGNIVLDASGNLTLSEVSASNRSDNGVRVVSSIQNVIEDGGAGKAGDIVINAQSITVSDNAQVITTTLGTGIAGNINITTTGELSILNGASLRSESSSREEGNNAGNIGLNIGGEAVFSGNDSGVFTTVRGGGRGGFILIVADNNIEINRGAQISSSNSNDGDAGTIGLVSRRTVSLDNGSVSSSAERGEGGQIRIDAENAVILRRNSNIVSFSTFVENSSLPDSRDNIPNRASSNSVENDGQLPSRAGNNNARFSTLAASAPAIFSQQNETGNTLIVDNVRVDLDAEFNSPDSTGTDGGNITIESDALVVIERSDIVSLSRGGVGGEIISNNRASFIDAVDQDIILEDNPELTFEQLSTLLRNNDQVIINSEGATAPGEISVSDDTVVEGELAELPDNLSDSEILVASSCITRSESNNGTFTLTDGDRIPQTPTDALPTPYSVGTVQTLPTTTATTEPNTITEPSAVYELADGRWVMGRECES